MSNRKFMIAYGVWNKVHMIRWFLEGVAKHASDVDVVAFFFDGCVDGSEVEFDAVAKELLPASIRLIKARSEHEVDELATHNALMRVLIDDTDCDAMLIFQDDMRLERAIHHDLDGLMERYGDKLGYVGGRDGFGPGLSNFLSSVWSESILAKRRLVPGEYIECRSLNIGPVAYTRNVIEQVGLNDDRFAYAWWYCDYCARCEEAGLTNILLGTGVTHKKWGPTPAGGTWTKHYDSADDSAADQALLHKKWASIGW